VSFFIKIVPCKIATNNDANPFNMGLCTLPNPLKDLTDFSTKFYGISNNPLTGLVLQFLIPAILFLIIFLSARKKAGRVLDLTKK